MGIKKKNMKLLAARTLGGGPSVNGRCWMPTAEEDFAGLFDLRNKLKCM